MTPEEIKAARKSLGLSQKQLGEALGVATRTIRRWEASGQPNALMKAVATINRIEEMVADKNTASHNSRGRRKFGR